MDKKRKRRNYLPSLLVTLAWWTLLALVVFGVDPAVLADFPISQSYMIFFGLVFLAVGFLMSLILVNTRRGFLIALVVIVIGYLKLWELFSWLNLGLLIGATVMFELAMSFGNKVDKT